MTEPFRQHPAWPAICAPVLAVLIATVQYALELAQLPLSLTGGAR